MALAMIDEAERRGELRAGMTVVEYTGGSTEARAVEEAAAAGARRTVTLRRLSAEP